MIIKNKERVEELLKGDIVSIDIGCGGVIRGPLGATIGIDISDATAADIIGDVLSEELPLEGSSVDQIYCHDFIEHVPFAIWHKENGKLERELLMVKLWNDMFRVLKHNGTIEISVPYSDTGNFHRETFQDPTHVSFWTPETFNYFTGDYYGFHDVYGHTSRFKKVSVTPRGAHLLAIIRADKESTGPYEV